MRLTRLGNTNTLIPVIGQGTLALGSAGTEEHVRLLRLGVELGMSLIDTAEVYGAGYSEVVIGKAIRGIRDEVFVATKFSSEHSNFKDVINSTEASLRRLGTDRIDLLQVHWPNPRIAIEATMSVMEKLGEDGKVRYIGLCNFTAAETRQAQAALSRAVLVSMQQEYNLVDRTAEQTLIPLCRDEHLTFIAYSPLAKGTIAADNQRRDALLQVAQRYGMSLAQLVLGWLVRDPMVVVIPKSSSESHLRENGAALDYVVEPSDYEMVSQLCESQLSHIPTDLIQVASDGGRNVYTTLDEALENRLNLQPSPAQLAEQVASVGILKPVKVKGIAEGVPYQLIEGVLRYWAWVIAHKGQVPIPALVVEL